MATCQMWWLAMSVVGRLSLEMLVGQGSQPAGLGKWLFVYGKVASSRFWKITSLSGRIRIQKTPLQWLLILPQSGLCAALGFTLYVFPQQHQAVSVVSSAAMPPWLMAVPRPTQPFSESKRRDLKSPYQKLWCPIPILQMFRAFWAFCDKIPEILKLWGGFIFDLQFQRFQHISLSCCFGHAVVYELSSSHQKSSRPHWHWRRLWYFSGEFWSLFWASFLGSSTEPSVCSQRFFTPLA